MCPLLEYVFENNLFAGVRPFGESKLVVLFICREKCVVYGAYPAISIIRSWI